MFRDVSFLDILFKLLGTSGSSTRATGKVAGPCAALVARRLMGFGQLCTNRGWPGDGRVSGGSCAVPCFTFPYLDTEYIHGLPMQFLIHHF